MAIELMAGGSDKGKGRAAVLSNGDEDEDVYDLPPPLSSSLHGSNKSSEKKKKKQEQKSELKKSSRKEGSSNDTSHSRIVGSSSTSSNFKTITAISRFPLAPIFALDSLDGVRQCLQSWTMRWGAAYCISR